MTCDEGHSFSAEAVTTFVCGPETEWTWNDMTDITIPICLGNADPKEIEHHFSVEFPGMKCEDIQSQDELRIALEKRLSNTLSTLSGCHSCRLKTVAVPGCKWTANQKPKSAADTAVKVLFSLVVFKDINSSSSEENVEEKSEEVLFQMQYAVAVGQFMISLHGVNTTAQRSSLKHLFSKVTCSVGSVPSNNGKRCVLCSVGSFHDQTSFECKPCGKGSYQDKEGQVSCEMCSKGMTTLTLGTANSDGCIEYAESVSKSKDPSVTLKIILGVALPVVFILMGVAVYWRFRNHWCVDRSTSRDNSRRRSTDTGDQMFMGGCSQDEMDGSGGNENPAEESEC